jgi:hypothetical protein
VQTKTISVTTDDPHISEPTILKLTATIPKLLEVTPAFLYWKPGEELTPKTISVKVGEFPVTKLAVSSSDPAISAQVAPPPNENEKNFQITVTPKEGNRPIGALLKIEPDYPKDAPKTFYANVRVDRRPPAAPAAPKPATAPKPSP